LLLVVGVIINNNNESEKKTEIRKVLLLSEADQAMVVSRKFCEVWTCVFELCKWTDRQTNIIQSYRLADRNTLHDSLGQSNKNCKYYYWPAYTWWAPQPL